MPKGDIETVYVAGEWHNRVQGGEDLGQYPTKDAAQAEGRKAAIARKVEHIIKNQDGQIAQRNSYGNDPSSSAG